jgi:tetratricopeptide (TPR) repeat protein
MRRVAYKSLPNPADERYDQAFCRKALGYYQEIVAQYRDDPEMQPIAAAADHRVGFIRMILKEPGAEEAHRRAIALYRELLAAAPHDLDLRLALALTYSDLIFLLETTGRPDAVLECFPPLLALRRALAVDFPAEKDNRISLLWLQADYSRHLEDAGRTRDAEKVRRQLQESCLETLAGEPNEPFPRNSLAWLLASRPDARPYDPAKAVSLAKEAVALAPTVGAYRTTLGVAQYRVGNTQAAAAALEESMRLRSGGDVYDWLFLAMVRRQLGDPATARRWYNRAVAWIEKSAPHDQELLRFRAEAARLVEPEGPPAPKPGENCRVPR